MGTASQSTVSGPLAGGRGWPFAGALGDLSAHGYVEEEYILEGDAVRYRLAPGTEQTRDGRWQAEVAGSAPYRTRMIVWRPVDPERFNGTVLVEWNNVSGGYDIVTYGPDRPEFYESGSAMVAVTAQKVGVHGLPGADGLAGWDPE